MRPRIGGTRIYSSTLCLAAIISLITVPDASAQSGYQEEQEPNDSPGEAQGPLQSDDDGAWVSGTLSGTFSGIAPEENHDYYYVYTSGPSAAIDVFVGVNPNTATCLVGPCGGIRVTVLDPLTRTTSFDVVANPGIGQVSAPIPGRYLVDVGSDGRAHYDYNLILGPGSLITQVPPARPVKFGGRVIDFQVDPGRSALVKLKIKERYRCQDGYRYSLRSSSLSPTDREPLEDGGFVVVLRGKPDAFARRSSTLIYGTFHGNGAKGRLIGTERTRHHGKCTTGRVRWKTKLQGSGAKLAPSLEPPTERSSSSHPRGLSRETTARTRTRALK